MTISRRAFVTTIVVLATILFMAINVFSNSALKRWRIDLTENSLYTLSTGTVRTLEQIQEPITLKFFFSERVATDFAGIRAYGTRVRDLLEEITLIADGKINLEIIDPEPFTEDEDQAVAYGLLGAPTQSGDVLYFGLAGSNTVDGSDTIPFFSQEREHFLEYDLTSLIHKLNTLKKPVLGVLSSLPLATGPGGPMAAMQGQAQPFLIYQQLTEAFDVETLTSDLDRVDKDIDVLLIAHPPELSDTTLYAIDQFIMRGGRALVFLDPVSELASAPGPTGQPLPGSVQTSNLPKLMKQWGLSMPSDKIVGDIGRAQRVALPGGRVVDYVAWLGLTANDLSTDDLVTAEINTLNLGTVGHLTKLEDATTTITPLASSTNEAALIDGSSVLYVPDPQRLLIDFKATGETYMLAARVSGSTKSAFEKAPEKPAVEGEEETAQTETDADEPLPDHIASSENVNVIVFADSDIFDDRFWVQEQNFLGQRVAVPTADNANLVVNAVDNLMGSNDLISLRSRARSDRPFTVVQEIRREAQTQYLREEQQLQRKLEETEARLADIQRQMPKAKDGPEGTVDASLLTEEQRAEVAKFRQEMTSTRKALRDVQRDQRQGIEELGNWLKFLNIGLVPAFVAIGALFMYRARRKRREESLSK